MIRTIPKIKWNDPKADIKGVLTEEVEAICDARLIAGEMRYGNSWCEVDLKTDALEELYDAINYHRFMEARARLAGFDISEQCANIIGTLLGLIAYLENGVPDFSGPTSNDWVKNQATTYDLS